MFTRGSNSKTLPVLLWVEEYVERQGEHIVQPSARQNVETDRKYVMRVIAVNPPPHSRLHEGKYVGFTPQGVRQ